LNFDDFFTLNCRCRSQQEEEAAIEAIKHAIKALRKRHLVEEGAHAPAITAISRPLVYQV